MADAKLNISINTPAGIGSYVHVLEPALDPNGKPKYSLSILIAKSREAELAPLKDAIQKVAVAKWGAKAAAIMAATKYPPIRDGDKDRSEDPLYKGMFYLPARSDRKPQVVGPQKEEIFTDDDIYSGCLVRANVTVFAYEQSGNRGISLGLNHVQLLRKGTRVDGRKPAEAVFDAWTDEADPLG